MLTGIVVAGVAIIAAGTVAGQRLPVGTEPQRRNIAGVLSVLVPFALPGFGVIAYLLPDADLICPYDATCSMPYAPLALLAGPVLGGAIVAVSWAGLRRDWSLRLLVPLLIGLIVTLGVLLLAGISYRITVPRP